LILFLFTNPPCDLCVSAAILYLYSMQHILLLHGAIGAKDQLLPLAEALKTSFDVHLLNFTGHGGEEIPDNFSIPLFAQQVLDWLDNKKIETISIFGYSMGGYVAMYLAAKHPGRIRQVMTLATKFQWDENIAEREVKMLDAKKIEEKVPAFARELQLRHAPQSWQLLLEKTIGLLLSLGKDNLLNTGNISAITAPVLIMLGDRDKMVSLEETTAVYKLVADGRMAVLPGTAHPIEQVSVARLAFEISVFMN
jgi:pimeloyl-ACP methyl ester carboxylesterase